MTLSLFGVNSHFLCPMEVCASLEMEMESHGGLSGHNRELPTTEKKNLPTSSRYGPLSARVERQSHPLAGQAQACGHPTQVDGPGGPIAPVVATG